MINANNFYVFQQKHLYKKKLINGMMLPKIKNLMLFKNLQFPVISCFFVRYQGLCFLFQNSQTHLLYKIKCWDVVHCSGMVFNVFRRVYMTERNRNFRKDLIYQTDMCVCWRKINQLDVTCYFISFILRLTCFGH